MERDGASVSLHTRLMAAVARGARAQAESAALMERALDMRMRVERSRAALRERRAERPPPRRER